MLFRSKDTKLTSNSSTRKHGISVASNVKTSAAPSATKTKSRPPSPCPVCKSNHWKVDCPQAQKQSHVVTHPRKTFDEMKGASSNSFLRNAPSTMAHNAGPSHRYPLRSRQPKPSVSFASTKPVLHSSPSSCLPHTPCTPHSTRTLSHSSKCSAQTDANASHKDF